MELHFLLLKLIKKSKKTDIDFENRHTNPARCHIIEPQSFLDVIRKIKVLRPAIAIISVLTIQPRRRRHKTQNSHVSLPPVDHATKIPATLLARYRYAILVYMQRKRQWLRKQEVSSPRAIDVPARSV